MTQNQIPSEKDWGDIPEDDLDLQAAYKDFFGKSNTEMQAAFDSFVIEMADGLRRMPPIPFRYYMSGFADFVMSGNFHEMNAPDIASSFLVLVEEKLNNQPSSIIPVMEKLFPVVNYLSENQLEFDADIDIYGDFSAASKKIMKLWESHR